MLKNVKLLVYIKKKPYLCSELTNIQQQLKERRQC